MEQFRPHRSKSAAMTAPIVFVLVALTTTHLWAQQIGVARFNPELLKASIVIEVKRGEEYHPIGSGVLMMASNEYVYVVTANHVVPADGDVYFRIPDKDAKKPPHHHPHVASTNITHLGWVRSASDDLAMTQFIWTDEYDVKAVPLTTQTASFEDVSVGDDVYVVGCPSSVMQMPVPILNINLPIINAVRHGIVSAKMDDNRLLIDAFVFPGNSGGPVFWKPATGITTSGPLILTGPAIVSRPGSLIGIVLAYAPYDDVAVSQQTGQARSISAENSGLAVVVSASRIGELFRHQELFDSLVAQRMSPPSPPPALPVLPNGTKSK